MDTKPKNILYLSCDKGIPIGGTKGAAVHIHEFLKEWTNRGGLGNLLAARKEKNTEWTLPFPVHIPGQDFTSKVFDFVGVRNGGSNEIHQVVDFCRNDAVLHSIDIIWRREPFDVIYERYSLFGISGLAASRQYNVPLILEVNSPLVHEAAAYRNLTDTNVAAAVERTLFEGASHIVAVSKAVQRYVKSVSPNTPCTVIPNGVDTNLFRPANSPQPQTPERKNGEVVIGFVGAVKPWHGVQILIEAFGRLQRESGSHRLMIVGSHDVMKQELQFQAEKWNVTSHITYTGGVPHEDVPQRLAQADILVAPYPELEDFYFSPLKLYEYMAMGKPIVASRLGQIEEIIRHEKTGLLVKPGDSVELASAIRRLAQDQALASRMGTNARNEAVELHSWKSRVDSIAAIVAMHTGAQTHAENGIASSI